MEPKKKKVRRNVLARIEFYHDDGAEHSDFPSADTFAFARFRTRMKRLYEEEREVWERGTIAVDSITAMEQASRAEQQFVLQRGVKDPRLLFGGSTDAVEQYLARNLAQWPGNVVVCAHTKKEKIIRDPKTNTVERQGLIEMHGEMVRGLSAPGRLSERNILISQYAETYRLTADDKGRVRVQTQNDGEWLAQTQIGAPDGCEPTYEALWKGWPKKAPRPPIHCLLYSDPGGKKTTMLATFPGPLLVLFFDGVGKELPFYRAFPQASVRKGRTAEGVRFVEFYTEGGEAVK